MNEQIRRLGNFLYRKERSAFSGAVSDVGTLFDDLLPNGPEKKVQLHVTCANDEDHFVVETSAGEIRVQEIVFYGELRIRETLVPLSFTAHPREPDHPTASPLGTLRAARSVSALREGR